MRSPKLHLRLSPMLGGAYTQMLLTGPVPTAPQPQQIRRLLSLLAHWSGWPVHVALPADEAEFCEVWVEALCAVPARDLLVSFRVPRRRLAGGDDE